MQYTCTLKTRGDYSIDFTEHSHIFEMFIFLLLHGVNEVYCLVGSRQPVDLDVGSSVMDLLVQDVTAHTTEDTTYLHSFVHYL